MFPLFDFFAKKRKITPDHVKRQQMTDWINQYRVKHFIFQNKIRHSRVLLIHTPSKGRVLSCAPSQESSKGQHLRRIKTIKIRVILTKTYTVLVNSLEFMTKRKVHWRFKPVNFYFGRFDYFPKTNSKLAIIPM